MIQKTTLVVMAAGMGSRFGGLKQAEPITEDGKAILDFTVYDAKKAGFNKAVFILREDMQEDFKRLVGNRPISSSSWKLNTKNSCRRRTS